MNLFCCGSKNIEYDEQRRHSKELDQHLKEWNSQDNNIFTFLLLGAGESGKSTLIKQMKILHSGGFSKVERQQIIPQIRRNILESIKVLVNAMNTIEPHVDLADPFLLPCKQFIHSIENLENYHYPKEFYDHTATLWLDDGVQKCYQRASEFQLIDSAKYFLDKISEVRSDGYLPNNQDILRCRKVTTDIQKIDFTVKVPRSIGGGIVNFRMFDVGGQKDERLKWFQVFEGIRTIIFIVDSNSFDMVIREDEMTNRLLESLQLFNTVWRNRYLLTADIILFMNKQDLLEEKIKSGKSIVDYFQEYSSYNTQKNDEHYMEDEYQKTKFFIKDKFMDICKYHPVISKAENHRKKCFFHFTCAVDSNNIKKVFENVHTQIIQTNMNIYNLA